MKKEAKTSIQDIAVVTAVARALLLSIPAFRAYLSRYCEERRKQNYHERWAKYLRNSNGLR